MRMPVIKSNINDTMSRYYMGLVRIASGNFESALSILPPQVSGNKWKGFTIREFNHEIEPSDVTYDVTPVGDKIRHSITITGVCNCDVTANDTEMACHYKSLRSSTELTIVAYVHENRTIVRDNEGIYYEVKGGKWAETTL